MLIEALNIIVVDDNEALLSVLSAILTECGHTVRTARDGFAALAEIRVSLPDVLLSDLNMPSMSGFELLSVVRRRFPRIAVIAMSGAYSGLDVPPGIAADAFYAKGVSAISRLLEIVNLFRSGRSLQADRCLTPIWIAKPPLDQLSVSTVYVACPECLRSFPQAFSDVEQLPHHKYCPHCFCPVQLAVVAPSTRMDTTALSSQVTGKLIQLAHAMSHQPT